MLICSIIRKHGSREDMLKSRNTTSNYQKTSQARKKYSLAGVGPCHSQEGAVVLTGTKILTPSQVILGSGDVHGDDEVDDGDDDNKSTC